MLFSMVVSLYTSRVILNMLGVDDYGIQNVVGGFVSMFALISTALSSSTGRFLTFELGKEDGNPKRIFSSAILIHLLLALIVLLAFETFGLWFLNSKMVIPVNRMFAANVVYQTSIFSFLVSLSMVPYNSAVIAHERLDVFAVVGIGEVIAKLIIVLFVAYSSFISDKLVVFSILHLSITVCSQLFYFLFTRSKFSECKTTPRYSRETFAEMFSFAGWNFIGCAAGILKGQGVNMLLNLFFGTVVNAAYGIATTVNNTVVGFASNFMTALNPQITKSYAANEKGYMFSLMNRGSRFSFYLILFFAIPLLMETEFILSVWLGEYPKFSVIFVRLFLMVSLVDIISNTLITAQNATGKIRNYQIAVGGLLMMNFPISYLFLKLGYPPYIVFIIAIAVGICCLILRLLFLRKMIGLSLTSFMKDVLVNITLVTICSSVVPLILRLTMPYGWLRFMTILLSSLLITSLSILFLGCKKGERSFIVNGIKAKLHLT